jgi:hypothetical protein
MACSALMLKVARLGYEIPIFKTACVRTIGGSESPVETAKEFAKSFRDALK